MLGEDEVAGLQTPDGGRLAPAIPAPDNPSAQRPPGSEDPPLDAGETPADVAPDGGIAPPVDPPKPQLPAPDAALPCEQTPEGCNGTASPCDGPCEGEVCGDGVLSESGSEQCDGAGLTLSCNADCQLMECPEGCACTMLDGRTYATCPGERNWAEANDFCTNAGGRLAVVDDATEQHFLSSNVDVEQFAYWLGARDDVEGEWRWTGAEEFWSGGRDGAAVGGQYTNWASTEPNNNGGDPGEDCLALRARSVGGEWNDYACDAVFGTICEFERPTNERCGDGQVQPDEACDAAGGASESCDRDCTAATCGDGVLNEVAGEDCDDGNQLATDGCHECRDLGLRAHWPLDATVGPAFHNRVFAGELRGDVAGYSQEGVTFDGVDDVLVLPQGSNPPELQLETVTVATHFMLTTETTGFRPFIVRGEGVAGAHLYVGLFNQALVAGVTSDTGVVEAEVFHVVEALFGDQSWHHAAASFDGQQWILYLDGVEVDRTAGGRGPAAVDLGWAVGAFESGGSHFAGRLSDLRIYDRPLELNEIQVLAALSP